MNEEAKKIFAELRDKGWTFAEIYDIATLVQKIMSDARYQAFIESLPKYNGHKVEND